jgi:hypothetical protein
MKKGMNKNKNEFNKSEKGWTDVTDKSEQSIDTVPLNKEVAQEYRGLNDEMENTNPNENTNWSQEDDRSEDLINTRDHFMQQPERNAEVPPELNQKRSEDEYDQYADLASLFEKERKTKKYNKW